MNIVSGIEQGSQEWLALRLGRVTASNFGKVLSEGAGKTRRAYMLQLLAERLTGEPQDTYRNAAMDWGVETEPRARAVYELLTGNDVEQVTLVERDANVACSPDGLVPDSGLEIKCPTTVTHLDYFDRGELPATYKPQVQGAMWVCETARWDFMSFDPRVPDACQSMIVTVERDDVYIARLQDAVSRFVDELLELESQMRGDSSLPGYDSLVSGIQPESETALSPEKEQAG